MSRLTVWASSISVGQFTRTEAAPPVQRRRRVGIGQARGLVPLGNVERRIRQILGQEAAAGTRDQAKHREPPGGAMEPRDGRKPAVDRNPRKSLAHVGPPPGIRPSIRRGEKRQADSRMVFFGTACLGFTEVMLPLELDSILAGRSRGGQSCSALCPACNAFRTAPVCGGHNCNYPYSTGLSHRFGRSGTRTSLPRFHVA